MEDKFIKKIREFNRFYTDFLGTMNNRILNSNYSLAESRILFEIDNNTKCTACDIVSVLNIDKSYLSRILKTFERNKLIVKKRSTEDARSFFLLLTEKGKSELNLLENEVNSRLRVLEESLTSNQRAILEKNMNMIKSILSGK